MQPNPLYEIGPAAVRDLIARAPWMQLVSQPAGGRAADAQPAGAPSPAPALVASPTPVLLAPEDGGGDTDPIVLETHLGRADARRHGLLAPRPEGETPTALLIVAGPHGYISPSWYLGADRGQIPTWNFEQANLTCEVEVLDAQANLATLQRLVAHFEQAYAPDDGVRLDIDDDSNLGMAMGTVGLRLTVTAFDAKSKMSQNKSSETRAAVLSRLTASDPRLAERMLAANPDLHPAADPAPTSASS